MVSCRQFVFRPVPVNRLNLSGFVRPGFLRLSDTWPMRAIPDHAFEKNGDRRVPVYLLALAAILALVASPAAVGQARKLAPIPVPEMLQAHTFGEYMPFSLSRDGRWVAYTLQDNRRAQSRVGPAFFTQSGASPFGNGCDIWVTDLESGASRNVTGGEGNNWSPAWSPDGSRAAFYSDRDGQAKLWVWEATTGRLRKVSDELVRSLRNPIQWTPDGTRVLTKVLPEGMKLEAADRLVVSDTVQLQVGKKSDISIYRSPAIGSKSAANGSNAWNLGYTLSDLVFLDIHTHQELRVARHERITQYWLSPDGTQVAYAKNLGFESADSQQILYDVVVYSLRTRKQQIVAFGVQLDFDASTVSWSPNSERIAFRTAGMSAEGNCFVVKASGDSPQKLTSDPQASLSRSGFQTPLWDAEGKRIYFVAGDAVWQASIGDGISKKIAAISGKTINLIADDSGSQLWTQDEGRFTIVTTFDRETKRAGFYQVNLTTGEFFRLREECKSFAYPVQYATAVAKRRDRVVYLAEDTQHGLDLWLSDSKFDYPKRTTDVNPQLEDYAMGEGRIVSWNSLDGQLLRGALLLPAGYQAGQHYPLIVKVYGGSLQSNSVNRFGMQRGLPENLQLLATRGYALLLPDAPLHVGTPMMDLMKTVLPGIDKVIEMGIADPDRLGVMGHSYGGYSTLCLLVQTPRFKAAMMSGGFGNLISSYGQLTSAGTNYGVAISEKGQSRMGGSPWEQRERYLENSPAFYLDRVETPLLIVHGAADGETSGVPPFLAEEIFVGLRRLGKPVVYAKYGGEDHWPGIWEYSHQVDFATRMIAWFDEYLKGIQHDENSSERQPGSKSNEMPGSGSSL
jgi:dipeptidyl aminopeptidase/acylaminoacyl peptidase